MNLAKIGIFEKNNHYITMNVLLTGKNKDNKEIELERIECFCFLFCEIKVDNFIIT